MSLLEINSISTASTWARDNDASARAQFDLAAIPTATTRTYAWPNVNSQVVVLSSVDTLTNKTIIDPTNNVAARSLMVANGAGVVSTFAAAAPATGQILTAGGASTATWGSGPLTTKGDLYGFSTTGVRVPVGADKRILVADSTQASGVAWAQGVTPSELPFGVVSATIAADTNDYSLAQCVQLRLTASGATRTLSGIVILGTSSAPVFSELKITNVGTEVIILAHESALSTASNRFVFDGADTVLLPGQNCTLWYDWVVARWRGVDAQTGRQGGQIATAGTLTPPDIATDQNDYAPVGVANAAVLRLNATTAINITGLAGGYNGRRVTIVNVGTNQITIVNQSPLSLVANRFFTGTSDTTLVGGNTASLIYDATSGYWRLTSGTGGGSTGAGGLIQSQWVEVIEDRTTTATSWPIYSRTINAAATLPTGTITVVSTGVAGVTPTVPGSPAAHTASVANPQTLIIQTNTNNAQIVTYTGTTGTTFTGCTGGTGAISVGNFVWNGPRQTSIDSTSNGVTLPAGTINCVSTVGFPTSGLLLVQTSLGNNQIAYTGTTATSFTGCTGGTGTLATGGIIFNVSTTTQDLLRINVTTSGGPLIIIATSNASTASNRTGYFQVVVDGFFRRGGSTQGNGGAPAGSTVVSLKLSPVPAGDHVVVVRWVVEGDTLSIRPVSAPQDNNASLLVQEVSS
jgi:hypothetical protein